MKDISAWWMGTADQLAEAGIVEGAKRQLSPVKYLFEVAHIYPQAPESERAPARKRILRRGRCRTG